MSTRSAQCGERAFAASVEMHDSTAAASFLHADAVFISARGETTRGAGAIAANWAPIIAGEDLLLRWYPNTVTIAGDPMVAIVTWPVLD